MIKRIFDFTAALAGLVVLSPMFLAIALWIKLDSRGPVFFRQQRVGKDGVMFDIVKFRTMTDDTIKRALDAASKANIGQVVVEIYGVFHWPRPPHHASRQVFAAP